MTDEPRSFSGRSAPSGHRVVSRRTVIRGGAVVAGAVWAVPIVTSVQPAGAAGSPPPTSTTTTTTGPTILAISGQIDGTLTPTGFPPVLPFFFHFDGTLDVPGYGTGTFVLDVETNVGQTTVEGPVVIQFASGTLVGDFLAEEPSATPNISPATLTITDGTGAFAGAHGEATGDLTLVPATTFFELDGPISGTLEIPA